jgi:hypothetical protein
MSTAWEEPGAATTEKLENWKTPRMQALLVSPDIAREELFALLRKAVLAESVVTMLP